MVTRGFQDSVSGKSACRCSWWLQWTASFDTVLLLLVLKSSEVRKTAECRVVCTRWKAEQGLEAEQPVLRSPQMRYKRTRLLQQLFLRVSCVKFTLLPKGERRYIAICVTLTGKMRVVPRYTVGSLHLSLFHNCFFPRLGRCSQHFLLQGGVLCADQ